MQIQESTLLTGPYDWDERVLPRSEFDARLARVRAQMAQAGVNVLIVHGDPRHYNALAYLTNFTPKNGTGLALVPLKFARYWDWTLGGNVPHSQAEQWAYTIPYLVLLVLGSLGVVRLWRDGHRSALAFLLIVMAGYMLPHLAVFGLIRMRMSVEWALILVGAAAMGELRWSSPHAVGSATRLAR